MKGLTYYGAIRFHEKFTAVAATHETEFDRVDLGEVQNIKRVVVRNQTNANSDVAVSLSSGGLETFLGYIRGLAANEWAYIELDEYLVEGERLKLAWSGLTAGDVIESRVTGLLHYREKFT